MGHHLRLYLFGTAQLERNDEPIALRPRKAVALFVYLVVTAQRHSRDTLATLLWPESSQKNARASLRRTLYQLNQVLPADTISATTETIEINSDADLWVDVSAFRQHVAACVLPDGPVDILEPACRSRLEEAAELYGDNFLSGFSLVDSVGFDDWQTMQRESLRRALAGVLAQLTHSYATQGQFDQAIGFASRWLTVDPMHEPAHRKLMQLYAWSGQRAAAVRQYEECERILRDEIGVDPAVETLELLTSIKEGTVQAPASPKASQDRRPRRSAASLPPLPSQPTPFIGRERELGEIGRLLHEPACHLLTIIGPGGIGKTRTALEAARIHQETFAQGTAYVSLTALPSAGALVSAIADSIGYAFSGPADIERQLIRYLSDKELLLVLDNFEHVLEGASVLATILTNAPKVTLLVTSRQRLDLQGEWLYRLDGLLLPDDVATEQENSAMALFRQSARRVRHDFRIIDTNRQYVVDICRLVGGMPLAIELAASWMRVLSTADVAAEIERDTEFLSTSSRDMPERHRSIQAVFDHSWALLSRQEQIVLSRLSVFHGNFDRTAAADIAGATLPLLTQLVDKSLVRHTDDGRYNLHDLLREYAGAKLSRRPQELHAATEGHARYYAAYLQRCAPALRSDAQLRTVAGMAQNIDNLRQAWDWMVTHARTDLIRRCVVSLWYFYELRGRLQEGLDAFRQANSAIETQSEDERDWSTYLHVLNQQTWFHMRTGQDPEADVLLQRSHTLLEDIDPGDGVARADAYLYRSFHRHTQEEWELSHADVEHALPLYEEAGDQVRVAFCHSHLGRLALSLQQYHDAYTHFQTSLAISRRTGVLHALASTTASLGVAAMHIGRIEEAQHLLQESLSLGKKLQYRWSIGNTLRALALLNLNTGDVAEAVNHFRQSAAIFAESADLLSYIVTLFHLGRTLRDDPTEAKTVLLDARRQAQEIASADWVSRIDDELAAL